MRRGSRSFVRFFFIDLYTRKVETAGVAQEAKGLWMSRIARDLMDVEQGILIGERCLIHGRAPLFIAEFLT
jgi:hypothetical protein